MENGNSKLLNSNNLILFWIITVDIICPIMKNQVIWLKFLNLM